MPPARFEAHPTASRPTKAFVVGSAGLKRGVEAAGVAVVNLGPRSAEEAVATPDSMSKKAVDPAIGAVVRAMACASACRCVMRG